MRWGFFLIQLQYATKFCQLRVLLLWYVMSLGTTAMACSRRQPSHWRCRESLRSVWQCQEEKKVPNVLHHLDIPHLVVHLQGFFKLFLFVQFIAWKKLVGNSTHMTQANSEASEDSLSRLAKIQIPFIQFIHTSQDLCKHPGREWLDWIGTSPYLFLGCAPQSSYRRQQYDIVCKSTWHFDSPGFKPQGP